MARQAAQAKLGFYPADPRSVAGIISHLKLPASGANGVNIIDPCCGEGQALHQIAEGIGVPESQVYGVELSQDRGNLTRALMPTANICSPASFLGMKITGFSFGLAYVNPPFDNELGGGRREEASFVEEAARILVPGGVMVLVCPITALNGNRDFCQFIDSRFEGVEVYKFPDDVRKFNEIVLIGVKRRVFLTSDMIYRLGTLHQMAFNYRTYCRWFDMLSPVTSANHCSIIDGRMQETHPGRAYTVPIGWKPSSFSKSEYLPEELESALCQSPLNYLLRDFAESETARPPLPPGKGHVALLLSSGMLNGVVEADDGNHVVRGSAKKVSYYNEEASKSEVNPDTGCLKTTDVYSEKTVLTIRAVWQDGNILTLSDQPAETPDADDPNQPAECNDERIAAT